MESDLRSAYSKLLREVIMESDLRSAYSELLAEMTLPAKGAACVGTADLAYGMDSCLDTAAFSKTAFEVMKHFARDYCRLCPVINECFEAGKDELWGVWGGTTPFQRRLFQAGLDGWRFCINCGKRFRPSRENNTICRDSCRVKPHGQA